MTRTLPATLLALSALILPLRGGDPPASAATPPARPRQARVAQTLGLTPDQQQRIQAIRAAHRTAAQAARSALREARRAFHQALRHPDTPDAQLRSLHQSLAEQELAVILTRRHLRQEIRQVLSPEQREQAAELRGRMQGARHGQRGGPGAGRR